MKTFKRAAARLCVAWLMGASGAVAQAGLLGDHTVTEVPVTGIGEVRLSFPTLLPNGDLLDPSTLINMVSAAMLRSSPSKCDVAKTLITSTRGTGQRTGQ
jgi:hypothetical protein